MRAKVIDALAEAIKGKGQDEIDSRLEIFCYDVAQALNVKFFPVQKKNVLELWFHDAMLNSEKLMLQVA